MPNSSDLAVVPVSKSPLKPAGSGSDDSSAWAYWTLGELDWRCRLTAIGLESNLVGPGPVALRLPAFAFDGERDSEISCDCKSLCIRYCGWVCSYMTDGEIRDTGNMCCNRNGRYRVFEATGKKALTVRMLICRAPCGGTVR